MRHSQVKERWRQGKIANCTRIKLSDPTAIILASRLGFDCLWVDLEHAEATMETLLDLVRCSRLGTSDVMARPGRWEFMRMARMLEAGAQGILYPRCESAQEAAEVVKWTRFAPQGERGFDGGGFDNDYGEYPAGDYTTEANEQTWIAIQIESPRALEAVDAIAAVEGVDMIFFGPGDYSTLSGIPGQVRSKPILKAAELVAAAAHRHHRIFGSLAFDLQHAATLTGMGARFLSRSADLNLLRESLQHLLDEFPESP